MTYQIGTRQYDSKSGYIYSSKEKLKLTNTQKKLLDYFLKNPNKIIAKQTLIDEVWDTVVSTNSVNQMVVKLRSYLEQDPSNPKIIITHFGQGYRFEAKYCKKEPQSVPSETSKPKQNHHKLKWLLAFAVTLILIGLVLQLRHKQQATVTALKYKTKKQLIILPANFDQNIDKVEQSGFSQLVKSAVTIFSQNEQTLYDETSLTTKQSLEKHFNIDKELLIVRSNISKIDGVYQAVIELTDGLKTIKKTTVKNKDLSQVMRGQMAFIAQYNQWTQEEILNADEMLMHAIGLKSIGDYQQAKLLLEKVLDKEANNKTARLNLVDLLIEQNQLVLAQSQLNTLKDLSKQQALNAEIQLAQARIKYKQKNYQELIADLVLFQSQHLDLPMLLKSKIQLQIGKAYIKLGNPDKALKAFKTATIDVDEQLNPLIYAQSYYGQGSVMITQKVDKTVEELFQKAFQYAQSAHNLRHQILSLSKLTHIYFNNYQWDKAISTIEKTIELAELANDEESQIDGLSSLVEVYNQRGYFSQAFEINKKIKQLAEKHHSDKAQLIYLFHDAIAAMNSFDWLRAKQRIEEHYRLSLKTQNYAYLLNNAFLTLEIRLLTHELDDFIDIWNQRVAFIKENGFERIQVYMDYYLARYEKQKKHNKKAQDLLQNIIQHATENQDIKMIVDASNQMAEIFLSTDAKKSLSILNSLEKFNPHPNPYLELKAKALSKLGKNMQALTLLNQAKIAYNESWTAENQLFMDKLKNKLK